MQSWIDQHYDGYTLIALKYCEGDLQRKDYMLNTTVDKWYYNLHLLKKYGDWMEQQRRKHTDENKNK